MPESWILIVVGGIGAAVGMFLRPFADKYVERVFARRPAFAFRPFIVRESWVLTIEPLNRMARKRRPLSIRFQSSVVPKLGILENGGTLQWKVDLSKIEGATQYLMAHTEAELQFFFDPSKMSEKMKVAFDPTSKLQPPADKTHAHRLVQTTKDFIENIASRRRIVVRPVELNLTRAFPARTEAVRWESVFDGKELCIVDVASLEIEGLQSKLLAEPRYAWVLN